MVIQLYCWDSLTVIHHAANFGGFTHCGSGDKTFLICHVITKDHVCTGLCGFMGVKPSQ